MREDERSEKLSDMFCDAIARTPDLSVGDIVIAAAGILGQALFETRCPECRKLANANITETVSDVLRGAMLAAAKRDRDEPPNPQHLH